MHCSVGGFMRRSVPRAHAAGTVGSISIFFPNMFFALAWGCTCWGNWPASQVSSTQQSTLIWGGWK